MKFIARITNGQLALIVATAAVIFSIAALLEYKINSATRRIRTLEQRAFALETETRTLSTELSSLTTVERVRSRADRYLPHYKTMTRDDVLKRGRNASP
jgi:cell division protein FtsL